MATSFSPSLLRFQVASSHAEKAFGRVSPLVAFQSVHHVPPLTLCGSIPQRRKLEILNGGRDEVIKKDDDCVVRPAGPWTQTVHNLLFHLQENGIDFTPVPRGFTAHGQEKVSYIPGHVCNGRLDGVFRSETALASAARLLRRYHDATIDFVLDNAHWQLEKREPFEVICHGDFAPYNAVFRENQVVGIIDFDTAHPGPRTWDICYALYRWAPIAGPDNPDSFGELFEQLARARVFCDAYGLPQRQRESMADTMLSRLHYLVQFMIDQALSGAASFRQNIADGHHLVYEKDIAYIQQNKKAINEGLV